MERDLGFWVDVDYVSRACPGSQKTSSVLGCLKYNRARQLRKMIVHCTLHLKYCVQFGVQQYKKDIELYVQYEYVQ